MFTLRNLIRRLSIARYQHQKIERMAEHIDRLKGEKFNTATEMLNTALIFAKEDGKRFFSLYNNRVLLIIAVADWLPARVESRIYMPSFSDVEIGNALFRRDDTGEVCLLQEIFVTPKLRGIGIGSALLGKTLACIAGLPTKYTIGGEFDIPSSKEKKIKTFFERQGFGVNVSEGRMLIHYNAVKAI